LIVKLVAQYTSAHNGLWKYVFTALFMKFHAAGDGDGGKRHWRCANGTLSPLALRLTTLLCLHTAEEEALMKRLFDESQRNPEIAKQLPGRTTTQAGHEPQGAARYTARG
jgi:hypothetical protein